MPPFNREQLTRSNTGLWLLQGAMKEDLPAAVDQLLQPSTARLAVFKKTAGGTAAITSLPTTSSVEISGNYAAALLASGMLLITGSTGNDGNHAIASASYSSGSNTTTIVLSGHLPSAVADGNVTLPELQPAGYYEPVTNRALHLHVPAGAWVAALLIAGELIPVTTQCVPTVDPSLL